MQGLQGAHEARVHGWRALVPRHERHETVHRSSTAVGVVGAIRVASPRRRPTRPGSRSESCRWCWAKARQCPDLRTGGEGPGPSEYPDLRDNGSGPRGPADPAGTPVVRARGAVRARPQWPARHERLTVLGDRPGRLTAGYGPATGGPSARLAWGPRRSTPGSPGPGNAPRRDPGD